MILTGAVHEARRPAGGARPDAEISTLAAGADRLRAGGAGRAARRDRDDGEAQADEIIETARRLIERRRLQERTGIIRESAAIQEVLVKIERMAPVSSTVLVQGERHRQAGGEGAARPLPRRGRPFITVNCALPETLLESELFGHEKDRSPAPPTAAGPFELADTGTIFLDEIGEILGAQVKLLVLESRTFFRVGGVQPIKVDVRVVAATNRPLRGAAAWASSGRPLLPAQRPQHLPGALAGAAADIPLLVRRFIREFARTHDRTFGASPRRRCSGW